MYQKYIRTISKNKTLYIPTLFLKISIYLISFKAYTQNTSEKLENLTQEAEKQYYNLEFRKAISNYQKIIELTNSKENLGEIYHELAICYRKIAKPKKALEYYKKELTFLEKQTNKEIRIERYKEIGKFCKDQEWFIKSFHHTHKAIKLLEKNSLTQNPTTIISEGKNVSQIEKIIELSNLCGDLGSVTNLMIENKKDEIAIDSLKNYSNISTAYLDRYIKYQNLLLKKNFFKKNFKNDIKTILWGMQRLNGSTAFRMNHFKKSIQHHQESLKLNGDLIESINSHMVIYKSYFALNKDRRAIKELNKALELQEKNLPWGHFLIKDSYKQLLEYYHRKGNKNKANKYLKKITQIYHREGQPKHPELIKYQKQLEKQNK